MRYDLAAMTRRTKNIRRSAIVIRDIAPPAVLASNLFAKVYRPIIQAWTDATPRIVATYERTLSAMVTDAPADIQAEIDATAGVLERLFLLLTPEIRKWALMTEQWHRGRWRGAVLSATGVDLGTLIGPADVRETLESYINWNVALAKDVSAQAQQRISSAVFSGLQNRTSAREVAKDISEAIGMGRKRSLGIAADQLSKVTSALADERRREAGLSVWKWRHSGKVHPRVRHKERDGNLYSDAPADVGAVVNGKTVLAAPDEKDRPSRPPWCGCRSQGVIIFD